VLPLPSQFDGTVTDWQEPPAPVFAHPEIKDEELLATAAVMANSIATSDNTTFTFFIL